MRGKRSTRLPATIRIGRRYRQDLGDLKGLAASIAAKGLIAPIAVSPDGELAAGERRLAAWRLAMGPDVPIPVFETDVDPIVAQYDENVFRENLKPSELVALMRDLTPLIQAESRARQSELGRRHGTPSDSISRKGETRTIVARLLGVSAPTLAKAAAVVDAAGEQPDLFGPLQAAMDRTGKVHGPFRRLVVMRQAAAIRAEPPPLPGNGPYRVIAADVPWPQDHDAEDQSERATAPYPRMTYAEIEAFGREVLSIAHDDCALFFAATNHHLPAAYQRILPAWGFEPKTLLTWGKDLLGRGMYLREKTEHWIVAIRGRPTFQLAAESTLLMAPRGGHSEKPSAFYDLVERVCPAPRYACLFSHGQTKRPGWDQHSTAGDVAVAAEPTVAVAAPPSPGLKATNTYQRHMGSGFVGGYRQTPAGQPTVPDLCPPGAVVRSSYGTGPYVVVRVSGPHAYEPPEGGRFDSWSLCLASSKAKRTKAGLKDDSWINELVAVDGRLLKLFEANTDEVFVEHAPAAALEGVA